MSSINDTERKRETYRRLFPYMIEMKLASAKCEYLLKLEKIKQDKSPWYFGSGTFSIAVISAAGCVFPFVRWVSPPLGLFLAKQQKEYIESENSKRLKVIERCKTDFDTLYTDFSKRLAENRADVDYELWESRYMPIHESLVNVVCSDIDCDRALSVQRSMNSWYNAVVDELKPESDHAKLQSIVTDCVSKRSDRGNNGVLYFGDHDN